MRGPAGAILVVGLALAAVGCEVAWGGADVGLEDPVPPPEPEVRERPAEDEAIEPLPEGPLVHLVRLAGPGPARLVPFARLEGPGTLAPLDLPATISESWRSRFDSVFLRPGSELDLLAGGARIGTVVVGGADSAPRPDCASVAGAIPLLLPGRPVPEHAFAVPADVTDAIPEAADTPEPVRAMTVAGPVLAERLIGGDRAYLAQRVSLRALRLPADTLPAMAATYLVADSLAPGPPVGEAISLFFVARFEPARGFVPVWEEVRRYSTAADKEVLEYLDWIRVGDTRLDFLRLVDGEGRRLAAGVRPAGDAEAEWAVDWREAPSCRSLEMLRTPAGIAASPAPAAGAGRRTATGSGGEAP